MLTAFLPLLTYYMPSYIRSHQLWAIIWVFSLLAFSPGVLLTKQMTYLLIYSLFIYLATITIWKSDYLVYNALFLELYEIAIGLSVITYFLQSKDYIGLANLSKWSIIFLFITAIMSIISSSIDPMYARNIIGISAVFNESDIKYFLSFKKYGGGNYSTAISFMCLFPLFLYYYKNIKISIISKKWIIILSIIFFLALLGMQIFANIIIALAFVFLALSGLKRLNQNILVMGLVFSLMVIIPQKVYVDSLLTISNFFTEKEEIKTKFRDLAMFLETGGKIDEYNETETAAGGRLSRYPYLLNIFIKTPIFGSNYLDQSTGDGFHLYWMHKLTSQGIIGFFFFLIIPYSFIKNTIRNFDSSYKYYYMMASLSLLSYGIFKVLGGREAWYTLFIILPGLYYLPLLKKGNHNL